MALINIDLHDDEIILLKNLCKERAHLLKSMVEYHDKELLKTHTEGILRDKIKITNEILRDQQLTLARLSVILKI